MVRFGTLLRLSLIWALSAVAPATILRADTFTEKTQATIHDITSQTEATTPTTRTRTTIGIGEKVTCSIDPSSWVDKDCDVTTNTIVDDAMGTVAWTKSGAGGSINNATGNSTDLTASKTPAGVTVIATIPDSGAKYSDAPIVKSKAFTVIAPTSLTYTKNADTPPWTAWTVGDKLLGARTTYNVVVNPTTVSFYKASIQENIATATDHWPDGSAWTKTAVVVGPVTPTQANEATDTQSRGLENSSKLYSDLDSAWEDFSPDFPISIEYQDATGGWVNFTTPTATRDYTQADRKTKVGVGPAGAPVQGSAQGPWQ